MIEREVQKAIIAQLKRGQKVIKETINKGICSIKKISFLFQSVLHF